MRARETRPVQVPGRDAYGAGRSLSRLGVGPLTFPVVVPTGCTGLGDPVDRVGSGQAEFGGPAFDVRPVRSALAVVRHRLLGNADLVCAELGFSSGVIVAVKRRS